LNWYHLGLGGEAAVFPGGELLSVLGLGHHIYLEHELAATRHESFVEAFVD
jgi:hypothetical protein